MNVNFQDTKSESHSGQSTGGAGGEQIQSEPERPPGEDAEDLEDKAADTAEHQVNNDQLNIEV